MSRFIYMQDFHYQGINSKNRLGNYSEDLLLKFDEIVSIAKQNNCDAILDGGDLFEGAKPAYNVLNDLADKIENAQIDFYSLLGNHNLSYGHIENSKGTGLIHLQKRCKYFKYLTELGDNSFIIKCIDYSFGIEDYLKQTEINLSSIKKEGDNTKEFKILIIHALITPSKFFDNASYIECKDIKTNADLVLLAHYHNPFKKKINGVTFLNIGCCGRLNINEAKIEPSVLLIDTDKRSYDIIKLKSAKKADEIFDLSKYAEIKQNEKSIDEFIEALSSATWRAADIYQQIAMIGKDTEVEKEVVEYLHNKIKQIKTGD